MKAQNGLNAQGKSQPSSRSDTDTVCIKLTRDRNEGRGLYVNVNDHNWFIPRGEVVCIPRYIAEVVERSALQDERTQLMLEELSARGERF